MIFSEGRGAAAEVDAWLNSGSTRLPSAGGIKTRVSPDIVIASVPQSHVFLPTVFRTPSQHSSERHLRRGLKTNWLHLPFTREINILHFCCSAVFTNRIGLCLLNMYSKLRNLLQRETKFFSFLNISALPPNPPDTPVGFNHYSGVKICYLPLFAAKSVWTRCDYPFKFTRYIWCGR